MNRSAAEIVREYGPFPGVDHVHGVTYDGRHVWFAGGDALHAFDPVSGETLRSIDVPAHAGTAFDGQYLYQLAEDRIQKIDPKTGRVLATIPAPGGGSGLAWAEGTLWVGQYRERKIHQVDPDSGAILRTIESRRFVTGVTWVDGELWHGTWEDDESDVRRVDPRTGDVLEALEMPPGVSVSGLESDGGDLFFCGGGQSGTVRAIRRPRRSRTRRGGARKTGATRGPEGVNLDQAHARTSSAHQERKTRMAAGTQTTHDIDVADVEYLRHGDKPLQARLFKPRGSGPFPIMVELHGGAWVRGDRLNGNAANEALARNGVIVAALDFRVPPVASYPASLADIHYGIRWCKTQASAWNGRADRIGAMGTSSGAHQAMLLGMRPRDQRYAALPLPAGAATPDGTLGCVIMVSPVIDPLGRYHYAKGLRQDCTPPAGLADRVVSMHDQYWQTEAAMAEGAPARILAGGERTATPPVLCVARAYEEAHPRPDLDEFVRQYRKAGGQIEVTIFEGEGEGLLRNLSSSVAQQALEQMTAFIHKHLG